MADHPCELFDEFQMQTVRRIVCHNIHKCELILILFLLKIQTFQIRMSLVNFKTRSKLDFQNKFLFSFIILDLEILNVLCAFVKCKSLLLSSTVKGIL